MRAQECVILAQNKTGAFQGAEQPKPDHSAFTDVASVEIMGGRYAVMTHGTLGTSTKNIEMLGPDGSTWMVVDAPTSGTYATVDLPPGQVRCDLDSGASGAYILLARIPVSE